MDKKTLQSILSKEKSDSDSDYRQFLRDNNRLANGKKIESGQFTFEEFIADVKTFVIIES